MCGIFAIYPSHNLKKFNAKRLLVGLGLLNDERGGDSHGVFGATINPIRGTGLLAGSKAMDIALDLWGGVVGEGNWIAGHTRYATHGSVNKKNAHPFVVGEITLAHNGIVDVAGYAKAHQVDSARLAIAMQELGTEQAISITSGSIGLVFSEAGKLRVFRSEQSLSWARGEFGWVVSSSGSHLERALHYAKLRAKVESVPGQYVLAPWYGESPRHAPPAFDARPVDRDGWRNGRTIIASSSGCGRVASRDVSLQGWPTDGGWATQGLIDVPEEVCDSCNTNGEFPYYVDADAYLCEDCAWRFGLDPAATEPVADAS